MQDPYFWDYLYGTTVPFFTPLPPPKPMSQCDTERDQCLTRAREGNDDMQHFCNISGVVALSVSGAGAALFTYGACALGRSWANAKTLAACNDEHTRCATRSW